MVFDNGPNSNEDQSRLINCAITGVFLNGSILTNSASIALAQTYLTNAAINAVARVGQTFTPVEGNTGTSAANIFVRQDGINVVHRRFQLHVQRDERDGEPEPRGLAAGNFYRHQSVGWNGHHGFQFFQREPERQASQIVSSGPRERRAVAGICLVTPAGVSGLIFNGSNGAPGWTYRVLVSTNLALPASQWLSIATNTFDANSAISILLTALLPTRHSSFICWKHHSNQACGGSLGYNE